MIVQLTLQIALYMLIGIIVRRSRIVAADFHRQLSRFLMDVSLPCLIISSLGSAGDGAGADRLLLLFAAGLTFWAALFIFGQTVFYIMKRTPAAKCARYAMTFSNLTFVGLPVIEGVFGGAGVFSFMLFYTPIRIIFYAASPMLMGPGGEKGAKRGAAPFLKALLTPAMIATFAGLALYFSGWEMPQFLSRAFGAVGGTCSPLGMIVAGMSIGGESIGHMIRDRLTYLFVFLRNFVSPAVILAVAYFFPADLDMRMMMAIAGSMPLPSLLVTYAIGYGLDDELCQSVSVALFVSTVLSVGTIPMWYAIAQRVIT